MTFFSFLGGPRFFLIGKLGLFNATKKSTPKLSSLSQQQSFNYLMQIMNLDKAELVRGGSGLLAGRLGVELSQQG